MSHSQNSLYLKSFRNYNQLTWKITGRKLIKALIYGFYELLIGLIFKLIGYMYGRYLAAKILRRGETRSYTA